MDHYFPQELACIHSLRMLSPESFIGGANSAPVTQTSCPTGWTEWLNDVTCADITEISGTGRWNYVDSVSHTETQE